MAPVDLGFSVADGEDVAIRFRNQALAVTFVDWQEAAIAFVCQNAIAFRWQEAAYLLAPSERDDSVYEVQDSPWLKQHQDQACLPQNLLFHHYKLNFNAAGVLEVLCSKIEKTEKA